MMSVKSEEREKVQIAGSQRSFVIRVGSEVFSGELEDVVSETEQIWMLKNAEGKLIRREVCEPVIDAATLAGCAREFFRALLVDPDAAIDVVFNGT